MPPMAEPTPIAASPRSDRLPLWLGLIVLAWWLLVALPLPAELGQAVKVWGRYPLLLAMLWQVWLLLYGAQPLREPRLRRAWLLVGLAVACVAVGDAIWGLLTLIGDRDPTFSIATLFFLGYFPLLLAGMLWWPRMFRSRADALTFTLDAATVAVGVGMLLWYLAVRPALATMGDGSTWRGAVALAFPIGDMLSVLGIALVLLRQPRGPQRRVTVALAAAMAASLAGDLLWIVDAVLGATGTQHGSYFLWLLQAIAFLLAAHWQRRHATGADADHEPDWQDRFQLLPHLASLVGFGLLAIVARGGERLAIDATLLAAAVLLLLVTLRQWLGLRENARLLAENERQRSESRFAALVEHASDPILILSADGVIHYASPAAWQLSGGAALVPGASLLDGVHPQDHPALADYLEACRGGLKSARLVLRFGRGEGPWTITETTLSNLLADAKVAGVVLNVRDVSEHHALEEQLRFEALHDPLTGLPNRELFRDRVAQALARQRQPGAAALAVALLGLDRLRLVADALGHERGEALLLASCGRLQAALLEGESLARPGTEELALLLEPRVAPVDLDARLESLRQLLAQPLDCDGQEVLSTASLGHVRVDPGSSVDTDTLLRNADIALQQARAEGGNRSVAFAGGQHARLVDRLSLEARLPRLLADEAFVLKFQPVLELDAGARPQGLKLSLEWRESSQAQSQPIAAVLDAVRARGLGGMLGEWVLQALQRDLGALLRCVPQTTSSLWLQLPLAWLPLDQTDLPERLAQRLRRIDWPMGRVFLEVEGSTADAGLKSAPALAALRQLGAQVALCGFGAGTQNLAQLSDWQPQLLELAPVLAGTAHAATARATLALASALRVRLSAAGIDDEDAATRLATLGITWGRGAALGAALPYERMLTWLGARLGEVG